MIKYSLTDKSVIRMKRRLQKIALTCMMALVSTIAFAQQTKTVTGQVVDETGEPLIGATVAVMTHGASDFKVTGAVTDFDGNFTIKDVPVDATLHLTYMGYKDLEVAVAGKTTFQLTMKPDNELLEEVVVIGYGVQKKSNVTGAISSVKSDDLLNTPIADASSALQGRVSGVQVVNNTGAPGATPTIRVRGYSSNGKSDPLYIVDGLKVSDISYLDPSSIKSMEVLKDAASAAIYGAEAGNGVILITTKNGDKGKTKITFDASWTFSSLAKKADLLNAEQYKQFYTEGRGDAFTTLYNSYNIAGTDTDWQEESFETGKLQKYNVGFQGGNDNGNFFLTLGYMNNDGMLKLDKDFYRRINSQINASYKIRPWLEIQTANTITYSKGNTVSEDQQYGVLKNVYLADPLTPVYYATVPSYIQSQIDAGLHPLQHADGRYFGYSWLKTANPVAGIYQNTNIVRKQFINGMTTANLTPFKNFVFTSRLGYTLGSLYKEDYHPIYMDAYNSTADTQLNLNAATYNTRYYQWENFANYMLETKAGDFSLMAGMSYSDYLQTSSGGKTNELSKQTSNFRYLQYSTNSADDYVIGITTRRRQIAYYGRLSWSYLDRYNAQFNFRADSYDAAYLDLDHNWGYFPSVSVGWTFANEDFFKGLVSDNGFTFGKLRLSYGVNGSISNLGGYMYRSTLNTGQYNVSQATANTAYWLNGHLVQGTYPSNVLPNPSLRWERSKQTDIGLDLRFFRSRLTATIDYYHKITDGLIVASVAPLTTGTQTQYQNLGKVTNSGLELELEWRDNIGDFSYGIKGNIATVKNKVKEYKGEGTRIGGANLMSSSTKLTYFEEGYPLWYIRGYQLDGIDSKTGEPIYHDFDGDGSITENDRTNLGSAVPDFTYGLTLNAAYKGFDVMVYGSGASGNKLVYGILTTAPESNQNRPTFLYDDRWTSTHTTASMPSAVYQINDSRFYNSSAFVFNASYFKIKQIQLGYSLPKKLISKVQLENVRAYVSLDNFFTFTSYPGTDPEVNGSAGGSQYLALDMGGYPMAKSFSFGLNVAF